MDNLCLFCKQPVKYKANKYCSIECCGFAKRGRARGNPYQSAKNYTRISVGKDLIGRVKREYLHRFVAANCIRPLREGEIVHHKDENKFNNEPSNLEILKNQSEHLSLHLNQRYHQPIIEVHYGYDLDGNEMLF